MRAFLSVCLLLLFMAGALAQNKTAGNIGIWTNSPAPNSMTDSGDATAPGNFTVTGNLNVIGGHNIPGIWASVSNNANLKAACATGCVDGQTVVFRIGYNTPGDRGAGYYRWFNQTCAALAGGAPADEGNRVATNSGTCFVLEASGMLPVELWGVLPTSTPAENATRLGNALTESGRTGYTLYLGQTYPTLAVTVPASCPSMQGPSVRAGLRFAAAVTTGLSITCPRTARNLLSPAPFIHLSNFSLITSAANGGQALELKIDVGPAASDNPYQPIHTAFPSVVVEQLLISGDDNCGTVAAAASGIGADCFETSGGAGGGGLPTPAHYWTNGVKGTNLSLARFENMFIYGTANPSPNGPGGTYPMQNAFFMTTSSPGAGCDAPHFFQNEIWGVHWALHAVQEVSGRACEAYWFQSNNVLRNDYGVYLDGTGTGTGNGNDYSPPQSFITTNSMECQFECVWVYKYDEVHVADNIMYTGLGYLGSVDTGSCMRFSRAKMFSITSNRCTNIGAIKAGTYGGVGSTGLWIGGTGPNFRSDYGIVANNLFDRYEGGVHLTENSREVYSEMNFMAGSDGRPLSVAAPRYIYKDDSTASGNFLTVRCGAATAASAAAWAAGLRNTPVCP